MLITSRPDRTTTIEPVLNNPNSTRIMNGAKSILRDYDSKTAVFHNVLSHRPPPPSYEKISTTRNTFSNFNGLNYYSPSNTQQHISQPSFDTDRKRKVEFEGFHDDGKKRKLPLQSKTRIVSSEVNEICPELYADYNHLRRIEQKFDSCLRRKSLEFESILKKPHLKTQKLRIFVITKVCPGRADSFYPLLSAIPPSWEMVIEGVIIDQFGQIDSTNSRSFSTFLQSLTIVLDEKLYGPHDHTFEWTRFPGTKETKGFCIKRIGHKNVKYSVSLQLKQTNEARNYYKWNKNLANLLGLNAQNQYSKDIVCRYLWQYIKSNSLQDATQNEYINLDENLKQIFRVDRMLFRDIPLMLPYLMICPPPVVISDIIRVEQGEGNNTIHLDLDIDLEDSEPLSRMKEFLEKTKTIETSESMKNLNNKLDSVLDRIEKSRLVRDFHLQFQKNPQKCIHKWLQTNTENLKIMKEIKGNPEEERRSEFYNQTWIDEAATRYVQKKLSENRTKPLDL